MRDLVNLGFAEKEAAVYIAALTLGPSSVQEIAQKSGINRATAYLLIESLIERGLMSSFVKDKKKSFEAEPPDRLLSILRLQKHELEEKEKELIAVMPKLLAIHNLEGAKPQIRYLEGFVGVTSIMKFFEETEGDFIEMVSIDDVENLKVFYQYHAKHVDALSQRKIPHRLLAIMKEPDFSRISNIPGGEVRIIPAEKFPLHGDISVRGNTVFMYSFKDQMIGVVITSADIANTIRQLFNIAWEGSGGYMSEKR
jgi:sugar-specific transcriptional regulator TrmB